MSDSFLGEIRVFAFDYAPQQWAFCRGQLMPVAQNTALFQLIGTAFGGDGRVQFALPDLQGRAPMGVGQGPDLSPRHLGAAPGLPSEVLLPQHLPAHEHALWAQGGPATTSSPVGAVLAQGGSTGSRPTPVPTYAQATPDTPMAMAALAPAVGGGHMHNNTQPCLALNFCISLHGSFPVAG
ncbi:phage tail protein [Acidovorax lacteus]|uniref:Tail fiber protein n=1 Tax=Acidovorax lacteus TaxID=1924988 RepID=A0ABP8LC82_9BURK